MGKKKTLVPPDERLALTPDETAVKLGMSRDAVYKAIHAGQIPSIRIGALIKVPRVQLERLLSGE